MSKRQFTADPETAQGRRRQLVAKLEAGFQRVQTSDEYRCYLATVSRFHKYSVGNTMLIWLQRPDASQVAGFHSWLSFGRHVRKGEKGIKIFAPCGGGTRTLAETDPETGEEIELTEIRQMRFRVVSVFDISQTDGADLPDVPISQLAGTDEYGLFAKLAALAASEGLTLDRDAGNGRGDANGWYARHERRLWVSPTLSPIMAAKTLTHELAHHFAEHVDTREEHETIAESVAYIVLGHHGIDASDYSFGYLASWSDIKTFRARLADTQRIASQIIERIEGKGRAAQAA
jgi:N-terminal domain of anti-restriction factor ArdC